MYVIQCFHVCVLPAKPMPSSRLFLVLKHVCLLWSARTVKGAEKFRHCNAHYMDDQLAIHTHSYCLHTNIHTALLHTCMHTYIHTIITVHKHKQIFLFAFCCAAFPIGSPFPFLLLLLCCIPNRQSIPLPAALAVLHSQ